VEATVMRLPFSKGRWHAGVGIRWLCNRRYRLDKTGARIGDESDGHKAEASIQVGRSATLKALCGILYLPKAFPNRTGSTAGIGDVDY